jgi:hypothetical protein
MNTQPKPTQPKTMVEIEHTPLKLITQLEKLLAGIKDRNGGFARINIEIANGEVKRFEFAESYLMSAL